VNDFAGKLAAAEILIVKKLRIDRLPILSLDHIIAQ